MKRGLQFILTTLTLLPFARADVTDVLGGVWDKILFGVGDLRFLGLESGVAVIAFTRILIWILVFTIFFAVFGAFSAKKDNSVLGFMGRKQAGIVSAIIALIATIFMPPSVILGVGASYATVV